MSYCALPSSALGGKPGYRLEIFIDNPLPSLRQPGLLVQIFKDQGSSVNSGCIPGAVCLLYAVFSACDKSCISNCSVSKVLVPANITFQGLRAETTFYFLQGFGEV